MRSEFASDEATPNLTDPNHLAFEGDILAGRFDGYDPDTYVAYCEGQIIAEAPSRDALLEQVRGMYDDLNGKPVFFTPVDPSRIPVVDIPSFEVVHELESDILPAKPKPWLPLEEDPSYKEYKRAKAAGEYAQYDPQSWVAIRNGELIGVNMDRDALLEYVDQCEGDRMAHVLVTQVQDRPVRRVRGPRLRRA